MDEMINESNPIVFSQDEQVRILLIIRALDPDKYPDVKQKSVIYKAQSIGYKDQVIWSAQ